MVDAHDPVSVAILTLLSLITIILTGYLSLYCYAAYKSKQQRASKPTFSNSTSASHWLESERKPLIPGHFHTQTIQPAPLASKENEYEDSADDVEIPSLKERDFSELGRIIFVIRYNKKREELMVRLVQIEGMPATQELYCPNSAYVDVGLKYTGVPQTKEEKFNQKPPRLDICLQQVYYFIISMTQMLSHSLEFRINTFDEEFRRYVCGMVEVKLSEEMGEDVFSGNEVVFVEEILEPFQISCGKLHDHADDDDDDNFDSSMSNDEDEEIEKVIQKTERMRTRSSSSSNMSWEPEVSKELISISTTSLWNNCISLNDITNTDLYEPKRSHSIGYLPAYEWTVKDIPLDGVEPDNRRNELKLPIGDWELQRNENNTNPTPESFYHIVPVTPLYSGDVNASVHRRVAYKKHPKRQLLAQSLTLKRTANKYRKAEEANLERSSSCPSIPSLTLSEKANLDDNRPEHHFVGEY